MQHSIGLWLCFLLMAWWLLILSCNSMPFVFCNFFHDDDSLTLGFQQDNIIYSPTPCQRLHYSLLQKCVTNSAKGHNTHLKIKGLLPIFSPYWNHTWLRRKKGCDFYDHMTCLPWWRSHTMNLKKLAKLVVVKANQNSFPCNCLFAYYSNQTRMFEHREVKKCVYELKPIWP